MEGETPDAKKVAVETPVEEMLLSRGRRRRSAGGGGGTHPLDRTELTKRDERRGVFPGVERSGSILRGNWAHPGR